MLTRRLFAASLTTALFGTVALPRMPLAADQPEGLRGSIDLAPYDLIPGVAVNQGDALNRVLRDAASAGMPVVLPAGDYVVSDIDLPDGIDLQGSAGATRLLHGGGNMLMSARGLKRLRLSGLVIDGAAQPLGSDIGGLLHLQDITDLTIDDCAFVGSPVHGIQVEGCGGRIARNRITAAAKAGLYAIDSRALSITGNTVSDCGNGGILVHRWEAGADGTMISGNRISRIGATAGGTGENGNGINVFRAANVMVSGNHVSDCAFSAIRANAATNVQITDNQCLRSGETAIYSEFGFEGAIVSDNLIDGAANGILIVNFNDGGRLAVVSGNLVRNLKIDGPYIHDGAGFGFGIAVEADTVVSGNVVENAPKYGLMLGWGPYLRNIVATGNLVRGAAIGCAVTVAEGAGTALISDNLFQDVPGGGIVGFRWNEKATGDLMTAGAETFPHLTLNGNRSA
ncbi:TIGR03808 family TAT-translocated repetitive protein [Rhizobium sp. 32-5/1]|uniref:TIGR03808 family TAT-translocated repetitive protein n=1 Tax=Rhizobium sp. 32-5/1 TaxID=3019602 RepID=UPI00240E4B67|nr:TIGR03808 family TAT-translocated repetitive protein [Rhizobium sp. 32-5/1]WEZ84067.1 TIGR03808 family TAT-translocated repetitive protein [Rhizobium sp. 32-5/1]